MAYCQTCKTKYWCCGSPKTCKCTVELLEKQRQERIRIQSEIIAKLETQNKSEIVDNTETTKATTVRDHKFSWIWNWSKCIHCWEYRFYSNKPCI